MSEERIVRIASGSARFGDGIIVAIPRRVTCYDPFCGRLRPSQQTRRRGALRLEAMHRMRLAHGELPLLEFPKSIPADLLVSPEVPSRESAARQRRIDPGMLRGHTALGGIAAFGNG